VLWHSLLLQWLRPLRQSLLHYSWQQPHARVVANGPIDLVWQPQPFRFQAGKSVRYIDFEKGSDANDGKTPAKAWKHHPWDAAAPANIRNQRGIDTFVFKRGVVYRGTLKAAASGTTAAPIRLTNDPKWGAGEATMPVLTWCKARGKESLTFHLMACPQRHPAKCG
jgi:hypothetical protein